MKYVITGFLLASFAWASNEDYKDAKISEQQYCKGVQTKAHHDYKSIYKEVCHGKQN